MHALEKQIDKFCRKHPNFGIPNLMLYIAVANVGICLIDAFTMNGIPLSSMLYFSRRAILDGQIWRLVTFALVPESSGLLFSAISAYFYYWIGSLLEREWGTARFNIFYLSGILFNIVFGLVTSYASMYYVNMSLFFSFAVLYPDMQILLFFILPIKVKWLAWIDAAFFAWEVISALLSADLLGALLPLVAILNFFVFFWSDFTEALERRRRRYQHQHSQQTINFKKATKAYQEKAAGKAYQNKGYIHKCAVCGKTDTDFPDMVFRYCSKCNGYYCYCEEHINNHEHIQ